MEDYMINLHRWPEPYDSDLDDLQNIKLYIDIFESKKDDECFVLMGLIEILLIRAGSSDICGRGFFFTKRRKTYVLANNWLNKIESKSKYKNIQLLQGVLDLSVKIKAYHFLLMIHNHVVHFNYKSCNCDMKIRYEYQACWGNEIEWKNNLYPNLNFQLNELFESINPIYFDREFKRGLKLLELSAENGNITAAIFLGILYQDERNTVCKDKRKGQMYLHKGESLLKRRAEQGSKICQDILLTYPN